MNLLESKSAEVLRKFMHPEWAEILSNRFTLNDVERLSNIIKRAREQNTIYPNAEDVFKAFEDSYMNIKVVIVGQDPYFNGNADGLAFSCKKSLSLSLEQILKARDIDIKGDVYQWEYDKRFPHSLKSWSKQGVFLYNPTLTIVHGIPNSHEAIWKDFSKAVFECLMFKTHLVWMLWGSKAKLAFTEAQCARATHAILVNEHPASAARNNRTWKCNHFSKANKYLRDRGMEEIQWTT